MRLFLASNNLGNFAEALSEMIGKKKRALIISNARDYYQDETRIEESLAKTSASLKEVGIENRRLDLRLYFGKADRLANLLTEYDPGLVFAIGGNIYCLATALAASGMDNLIRQGLKKDLFVYGGYSAGSMIASSELKPYIILKYSNSLPDHNNPAFTQKCYEMEPCMQGLGIIDEYIMPHMDIEKHAETTKLRLENLRKLGLKSICLNDLDVYIVDNNRTEILKGE